MYEVKTLSFEGFGYREIGMAAELLNAYAENPSAARLQGDVSLGFNTGSGNVFLTDEDGNVAMMNGKSLVRWYICPECGEEGFEDDITETAHRLYDGAVICEDDDECSVCGGDLNDGDGYDGLCGDCADKAEAAGKFD